MAYALYLRKPESDHAPTRKRRRCLMCCKLFMSAWPGQHICPDCKHTGAWRDGESWLPGEHCPFCAYGIEKKLSAIEGVEMLGIDIESGSVMVTVADGATLEETAARRAVFRHRLLPERVSLFKTCNDSLVCSSNGVQKSPVILAMIASRLLV